MDNNEPFYVGKGIGNRAYNNKRNKMFMDIIKHCEKNSIKYYVSILADRLTEEQAYGIECWYINKYMIEYGYKLTNATWGGEGGNTFSLMNEDRKKEYRKNMRHKLLGKNTGKRDPEVGRKISKTKIERGVAKGKNNPMCGRSCTEFMDEKAIEKWKENISKAGMGRKMSDYNKKQLAKRKMKTTELSLNGEKIVFNSRNECTEYIVGLGLPAGLVRHLLETRESFNPKTKKEQFEFRGMTIKYLQ